MDRDYVVSRDGTVTIEEKANLVAIRAPAFDPDWGTEVGLSEEIPATREANAFDDAGWKLALRDGHAFASLLAGQPLPGAEATGRVYRYQGRTLIGKPELAVQVDPGMDANAAVAWIAAQGFPVRRLSELGDNLYVIGTRAHDPFDIAEQLRAHVPQVEFAEPTLFEVIEPRAAPNDTWYGSQWNLARIHAPGAWKIAKGAGIRIAVVDTDFDENHEDLQAAITNDSATRNAAGNWTLGLSAPSCGHGTQCASVAGARGWNSVGLVGVAPESRLKLLAIKEGTSCYVTDTCAIAEAFSRALKPSPGSGGPGAHVISCSLGSGYSIVTNCMKAALFQCRHARAGRGVPVFWAVGNAPGVPMSHDPIAQHPRVIAVGRTDTDDSAGPHSTGPGLEFVAPGHDLVTALDGVNPDGTGKYSIMSQGTSYATATAAGVAALMIDANPKLRVKHIRRILRLTADKVGPDPYLGVWGWNQTYGYGIIHAQKAVRLASWLFNIGFP